MTRQHGDRLQSANRRAFTLIEILSVVVILGLLAAMVVPQLGPRTDLDVAAAARIVMSDLLYAQNRAISTQGWTYVTFNTSNQNYTLYSGTSTGPGTTPITQPVTQQQYIMTFSSTGSNSVANASLSSISFGSTAQTLVFDESGTPYYYVPGGSPTPLNGAATIALASGTNALTVSIQQDTGDISVQ